MSKRAHYRAIHRMWSSEGARCRRFNRAIDRMERSAKTQTPHIVWRNGSWENVGGRGLIHNGRKP